jgi:hypothetical protein
MKPKNAPEYVIDFTLGYEFIFQQSTAEADKAFASMNDAHLDIDQFGKIEGTFPGSMLYRSGSNGRETVNDRIVPASFPELQLKAQIQLQQAAVEIIRAHRKEAKLTDLSAWPAGWSSATLEDQVALFPNSSITWDFSGLHDGGSTDLQKMTLKPGVRTTFSAKMLIFPTYKVSAMTERILEITEWTVKAVSTTIQKRTLPLPKSNVAEVRYIIEFDSSAKPMMLMPYHSLVKSLTNLGAIFAYTAIGVSILSSVQNFLHVRTMKWYAKHYNYKYEGKKLVHMTPEELEAHLKMKADEELKASSKGAKANVLPTSSKNPLSVVDAQPAVQQPTATDGPRRASLAPPMLKGPSQRIIVQAEAKQEGKEAFPSQPGKVDALI